MDNRFSGLSDERLDADLKKFWKEACPYDPDDKIGRIMNPYALGRIIQRVREGEGRLRIIIMDQPRYGQFQQVVGWSRNGEERVFQITTEQAMASIFISLFEVQQAFVS